MRQESSSYEALPPLIRDVVLDLVLHPAPLPDQDVIDLAYGRLVRLCGHCASRRDRDLRTFNLALIAVMEGRGIWG